jgi:hypothetical protein
VVRFGKEKLPPGVREVCKDYAGRVVILTEGLATHRGADRLYPRTLGPRELEAVRLVEQRPGITIEQLAGELGVTMQRVWQIVGRLEAGRVRREADR